MATLMQQLAERPHDDSECSICFCEIDEIACQLVCGHRFCRACLAQYLSLTISEAPLLYHKRSFYRRDDIALSVCQRELVGVPCPQFACRGVIEAGKIRALAPEGVYAQFDLFALEQQLTRMLVKSELRLCPLSCGNYVQDECLCVNPECRIKQREMRERERKRLQKLQFQNDERLEKWALANPDLVRLCPLCKTQIEKNGGCDHMFCSTCKQPFLWSKALPFSTKGHWLQKAREDYLLKKDKLEKLLGVPIQDA